FALSSSFLILSYSLLLLTPTHSLYSCSLSFILNTKTLIFSPINFCCYFLSYTIARLIKDFMWVAATRGMSKSAWSNKVREGVAKRKAKKAQDAAVVAGISGPPMTHHQSVQESQSSVNNVVPTGGSRRRLGFDY
ncbi:hypothetical protein KSS87_016703, partial [Heliosperma pusillum]